MEDPYNSTENACDASERQGKQSAKESLPGALVGAAVGAALAYIAKKIGIPIPDGMGDVITGAILAIPTGAGSIISSFHLGNRR